MSLSDFNIRVSMLSWEVYPSLQFAGRVYIRLVLFLFFFFKIGIISYLNIWLNSLAQLSGSPLFFGERF